jgi:peptidoglycan/LPS O-acetylase OafA/YrhL
MRSIVTITADSNVDTSMKVPFHIPSLDGIRTVAFAIVFLGHTADFGDRLIPGGLGVTIFFFLSGYLITTLMRREVERKGSIHFKAFYMRRLLRIFPPFYVVVAIGLFLTAIGVLKQPLIWQAVMAQLFYYGNYYAVFVGHEGWYTGSSVIWSLAVEEHFYFLFPLFYWGMLRFKLARSTQAYVIWGLCALTLLWRVIVIKSAIVPLSYLEYASDARFDSMLFGCALAVYGNPALDPGSSDSRWRSWGLPASLGLLLLTLVIRDEFFRYSLRYSLQGIALYPIFICAIRYANWGPFRWLNLAWVTKIGQLSYLLYLVHFTMLNILEPYFPHNDQIEFLAHPIEAALLALSGFTLSLAIAWVLHHTVERPALKLKHRFSV